MGERGAAGDGGGGARGPAGLGSSEEPRALASGSLGSDAGAGTRCASIPEARRAPAAL